MRSSETEQLRQARLEANREQTSISSAMQSEEVVAVRRERDSRRHLAWSSRLAVDLKMVGFNYNPELNYEDHKSIKIGGMDIICEYCQAKRFTMAAPGICCSNGKVNFEPINTLPPFLNALLSGITAQNPTTFFRTSEDT